MTAQERSGLFAATVAIFMAPFMSSAVTVALPSIQADLGGDAVQLGWVATAYILATAMMMIPVGRFADIHGQKRVFLTGIVVYTLSCCITALVPSISWLIGLRFAQGIGAALFVSTSMAILTSIFPPQRRGRALGIYTGAVYLGASVGPFAGGLITHYLGWRSIFLIMLVLGAAAFVVVARNIKEEWAGSRGEPLDKTGTVIYAAALCALVYGTTSLPGAKAWILILAGISGLVLFCRQQQRAAYPVFEIGLFRSNRLFRFSNLSALISHGATYAVTFVLSLFLQYLKGMSPEKAGLVLMAQPILQVCISPLAGRWSDRVEPRLLASGGMALMMIALAGFALVGPQTHLGLIIANLMLLGVGIGLFVSPNTSAIMGSVQPRHYGVASGVSSTMRLLGNMTSITTATLVISVFIGRTAIEPANFARFLQSSRIIFLIFSLLCTAGFFLSLARGRSRPATSA